jgi:acyl transferase domain-containing protein/acyl-CoA synthetase (AMP-forming)/AMP-acid ligase II/acyl carrier protein
VEPGHQAIVDAIAQDAQNWRRLLIDDDPSAPVVEQPGRCWTLLSAALAEVPLPVREPVQCDADNLAILLYTSGTTGRAKGVQLTHGNIWWNGVNVDSVADTRSVVNLAVAPLFHIAALNCFTLPSLARGGTTLIRRKFDPDQTLRDLVEYQVNTFFAVPSLFAAIARVPGFADADLSELHTALVGGAPVPRQLILDYADRGVMLQQAWGLTETAGCGTYLPAELTVAKAGSAGQAMPFTEIRLTDPRTGRVITDPDVRGQVCVRGPNVTPGYWRNREETEAAIDTNGWFHSGDIGYLDSDGCLFIVDRVKDIIIVNGENVYPAEVEHALTGCPGVVEVAVIGLPHDTRGEAVVAATTCAEGAELSLNVVREYASSHLAQYKLPVRLHVVESIPRNAAGKIDKNALRASLTEWDSDTSVDQPLAAAPAARDNQLLELVESVTIKALGYRPSNLWGGASFVDMGLDSLAAVELCDGLAEAIGVWLPATLVFDYPSPVVLAEYLRTRVLGVGPAGVLVPVRAVAGSVDPVVIVGMACRYPGGVVSPEDLWDVVAGGVDVVSGFPADRGWDLDDLFDPDPDVSGKTYTRTGGFLADVAGFDAAFFGISPREAEAMDPQQRLLLEVAREAIERSHIDPGSLAGTRTGVFTGVWAQEYSKRLHEDTSGHEGYLMTGTATSVASGRIAYTLGLEGPAITVDTACSSSLVALHLACQSLRDGECDLALAGGATVMATPGVFVEFARQRGLSPDGRCKAFAAAADGTGWGEGVGLLLLERLSDAQTNGHPVLAVIRGSAVNQNGASNGLTAPNGPSQQRVIRQALANARLDPADVDAVEAHGTGTTLGDPIEAGALLATYGQHRPPGPDGAPLPLYLGSIKSNIGHTQAAAGVAGVIKMVQALRYGTLPATLHIDAPSPHVAWDTGTIQLLTRPVSWPADGRVRRVGVSSFGISGTNAHLILEQAPTPVEATTPAPIQTTPALPIPWILSAKNDTALHAQAHRLHDLLAADLDLDLANVGLSLATTRTHFTHRAAILTTDRDHCLTALTALSHGQHSPGLFIDTTITGKLAFLFTGQGNQYPGMGQELHTAFPVFADALDQICAAFEPHLDRPLKTVMWALPDTPESAMLDQTAYTQPALFTLEVALFRLLHSWGVCPDHLAGHSIGELAAAHVSEVLSLADAAILVAARGRLMQALPSHGVMIAINATEDEVLPLLAEHPDRIGIAAVNGPDSVVVSGEEKTCARIAEHFIALGRRTQPLTVSHAFHSPLMEPILEEFHTIARGLSFHPPQTPIVSTPTGTLLTSEQACSPGYWTDHIHHTVRFADAVATLHANGVHTFLELGPGAILTALTHNTLPDQPITAFPALHTNSSEPDQALTALTRLHTTGTPVDWTTLFTTAFPTARRVDLPTYPFCHQPYWLTPVPGTSNQAGGSAVPDHPLMSSLIELDDGGLLYTGRMSQASQPWISDHVVFEDVVVPGTTWVELTAWAGRQVGCDLLEEFTHESPLVFIEQRVFELQLRIGPSNESGRRSATLRCRLVDTSTQHPWLSLGQGVLAAGEAVSGQPAPPELWTWPPEGAESLDTERFYERYDEASGYHWGPTFRSLRFAWHRDGEIFAEVHFPEDLNVGQFDLHPALLDASMHALGLALIHDKLPVLLANRGEATRRLRIPFAWQGVRLHGRGARILRVCLTFSGTNGNPTVTLADEDGRLVASVDSLVLLPISMQQLKNSITVRQHESLFQLVWTSPFDLTAATSTVVPESSRWAVLTTAHPALADTPPTDLHTDPRGGLATTVTPTSIHNPTSGRDHTASTGSVGDNTLTVEMATYPDLAALTHALEDGALPPEVVVWPCPDTDEVMTGDLAADVHALTAQTLRFLQQWLSQDRLADTHLVAVTQGAVATHNAEVVNLSQAALWGLIRTAQSEYPDRITLLDLEPGQATTPTALASVMTMAPAKNQPQLAIRAGITHIPRLRPSHPRKMLVPPTGPALTLPAVLDSEGTVLITGSSGTLAGITARHLAATHPGLRLLLVSRRGPQAPGARELARDLAGLGAQVSIVACDVANPVALAAVLDSVAADHPLTAVIHTAGVLDDATLATMTDQQLHRVLAAKADAAWYLHQATAGMSLSAFVLYSSAAGIIGSPGQGNYAAANSFLDALAHHRHTQGLPATSLAWGLWEPVSGMTAHLTPADRARMTRSGMVPITPAHGMALFDQALTHGLPALVAFPADTTALITQAAQGTVAPLLRNLVRSPRRTAADIRRNGSGTGLAARLAGLPENQRHTMLLDLVRTHTATVLGHHSPASVDPDSAFKTLGFDSLTAIELRNHLTQATGVRLSPTLIFDHPTQAILARYLHDEIMSAAKFDISAHRTPHEVEGLSPIFKSLLALNKGREGLKMLAAAAQARPTFSCPAALNSPLVETRLCDGDREPVLICLDSVAPVVGGMSYMRFAANFRGIQKVFTLPLPGYSAKQELPASIDALAEVQAAAIERCASGVPFVLVGHSSGGMFAHAAAAHLEARDIYPVAIVMIDTPNPDQIGKQWEYTPLLQGLLEFAGEFVSLNDASLTALGWYMNLIESFRRADVTTPTILIQAMEKFMPAPNGQFESNCSQSQLIVEAPGNHFTIMTEHGGRVAEIAKEFIANIQESP